METTFEIQSDNSDEIISIKAVQYIYIKVNNIDVQIKAEDEGVVVELYPNKSNNPESLASTWLLYSEAEVNED